MDVTKPHYIDPAQAAHNIASAFCTHEIPNLPCDAFKPGSVKAIPYIQDIWSLYSNVYDSVFEMALLVNTSSIDEE